MLGRSGQICDNLHRSVDLIDPAVVGRDGRDGHLGRLEPVSSSFGTEPHDETCIGHSPNWLVIFVRPDTMLVRGGG